jgi:hypothetical protein
MTTARTQRFHVSRGGAARPVSAAPKPDDFTPVSAEAFVGFGGDAVVEVAEAAEVFDPADHNVEDVKAYVRENPDQAAAITELELDGKARSGLLSFLEDFNTESED